MQRRNTTFRGRSYIFLQSLRRRPLGKYLKQLGQIEQLGQVEYDLLHQSHLTQILNFARTHVPFYKSRLLDSAAVTGEAENIHDWPILDKELLRTYFEELKVQPPPSRVITLRTSGSTGTPLRILSTPEADARGWAHRYQGMLWHRIPIGTRSLRFSDKIRRLRDFIKGDIKISMENSDVTEDAVRYLKSARPALVTGAPSTLFRLARMLRESGYAAAPESFARVGGEQLFDFQRREIEAHLCAQVINSYGSTETGALAGECPAGSMHIFSDHVHLEILRGGKPAKFGQTGDIVVTTLRNMAMPLIRYVVGDQGCLAGEPCQCGLPYPVLTDLRARSNDSIFETDGSSRHTSSLIERIGSIFASPVADLVRQFQIRQQDRTNWEIWLEVPDKRLESINDVISRDEVVKLVANVFRQELGEGMELHCHFTTAIPLKAGKLKYFRNDMPTD